MNLFLGTVGEVAGVRVVSHDEGCEVESDGCIGLNWFIARLICLLEFVCWNDDPLMGRPPAFM